MCQKSSLPGGESDVVHENNDVGRREVAEGQQGHGDDRGCRRHLLRLNHRQHLRHLALPEHTKSH